MGRYPRRAWDEWEQLKARAAERHSATTELNQLPADSDGSNGEDSPQGDLRVNQEDLAALDHDAEHRAPQTQPLLDATAHISNRLDYTRRGDHQLGDGDANAASDTAPP
ncbi:hypothetical protein JHN63_24115 [Streptomyces sp. MBT65]|uniref:hypothetical protein n=1 Tax=Streptomyces sp. MBT65 TaxID=1488395 RepID=UPI00190BBA77|nr:hypothetical protein [Streptomyces sp. MBT65]MBK3576836.1 hypothetical protein [Streptomyces sp. MBT65]